MRSGCIDEHTKEWTTITPECCNWQICLRGRTRRQNIIKTHHLHQGLHSSSDVTRLDSPYPTEREMARITFQQRLLLELLDTHCLVSDPNIGTASRHYFYNVMCDHTQDERRRMSEGLAKVLGKVCPDNLIADETCVSFYAIHRMRYQGRPQPEMCAYQVVFKGKTGKNTFTWLDTRTLIKVHVFWWRGKWSS